MCARKLSKLPPCESDGEATNATVRHSRLGCRRARDLALIFDGARYFIMSSVGLIDDTCNDAITGAGTDVKGLNGRLLYPDYWEPGTER